MEAVCEFDHSAFHGWTAEWVRRHAGGIAPARFGLSALTCRAVTLFQRQGKTVRAAALQRFLASLEAPSLADCRARRIRWRTAVEKRALRDPLDVFGDLVWRNPARLPPGTEFGAPSLWDAVWLDIEQRELQRGFTGMDETGPDPVLVDLLIVQGARQIPLSPPDAAQGCRTAEIACSLLRLAGLVEAGAVAAMLAVCFNPRRPRAHALLADALANVGSAAPVLTSVIRQHRSLALWLESYPPAVSSGPGATR